jgi:protein-S-isoprenylcysteine O-methyltransferase Ste14
MTLIPAFEIGVWNAWIFIVPYIFTNFVLTLLLTAFKVRKSTFWSFPSYTGFDRMCFLLYVFLMGGLSVYSVFLPLTIGTIWFYAGLAVYLVGFAFLVLAMHTFTATPVDKPNTTGIYCVSRHPWYIGLFSIYIGIGIASASWVYLLVTLIWLATYRNVLILPEERFCLEKFGNAYREYVNRTPRWIGIPKA